MSKNERDKPLTARLMAASKTNTALQEQHELQNIPQAPSVLSSQDFLSRVTHVRNEIRSLTQNIQSIQQLHQRALAESDGGSSSQALEQLVTDTQIKNTTIRDQLKLLASDAARTSDGSKGLKDRQVQAVKKEFETELRNYQQEEGAYRQRYQEQIARQYRIVNPDATEQEVQQAAQADWGNEGVFQTAVRLQRHLHLRRDPRPLPENGVTNIDFSSSGPTAPAKPTLYWAPSALATMSFSALSRL